MMLQPLPYVQLSPMNQAFHETPIPFLLTGMLALCGTVAAIIALASRRTAVPLGASAIVAAVVGLVFSVNAGLKRTHEIAELDNTMPTVHDAGQARIDAREADIDQSYFLFGSIVLVPGLLGAIALLRSRKARSTSVPLAGPPRIG